MLATGRITLVQETDKQFGFLVFNPIYGKGVPLDTVRDRREHLKGFALGVFRVGELVEGSLAHLGLTGIDMYIHDLNAPQGKRFLYFHQSRTFAGTRKIAEKEPKVQSDLQYVETIDVAGRKWKVLCVATPELVDSGKTWLPWGLFLSGLIITLLLTINFLNFARRNVSIARAYRELEQETIERKKLETEWTQFIDRANAPIFGVDSEGLVNEWNQTAERITGFSKEDVMGKDLVQEFITEEYQVPVKEVLDNALSGTDTANFEFPLFTKDGRRLMVLLNATTRRDADGKIVGVIGVGQDITELAVYRDNLEGIVEKRTVELNKALAAAEQSKEKVLES